MKAGEQTRFGKLYKCHLRALKLQGLSDSTLDVYSRAVRRVLGHFDCCPDQLTTDQLETYFAELVGSHSWSTVKVDRNGLQFFWQHVLKRDWSWVEIVKAPKIQSLPDILTPYEVEQLIGATRKLRYRAFLLTTYSMGLRLGEALSVEVGDIDGQRKLCIFAAARAIRIVWFRCPISRIRRFVSYGGTAAIPGCSSLTRQAPWSVSVRPRPTWTAVALRRP